MNRLEFVPLRILFCFFVLTLISLAQPRQSEAILYNFTATTLDSSKVSSFTLKFDDGWRAPADGLFEFAEQVAGAFSGLGTNGGPVRYYDLMSVPDTSCSKHGYMDNYTDPAYWFFHVPHTQMDFGIPATYWSYSVSPVPIPSGVLLLGTGFFCLAAYRRRKQG